MTKPTLHCNMPVFGPHSAQPLFFVTTKQRPGEIAGKTLPPMKGLWRKAHSFTHPIYGSSWRVTYYAPTDEERDAWENRARGVNTEGIGPREHLPLATQTSIAHGAPQTH